MFYKYQYFCQNFFKLLFSCSQLALLYANEGSIKVDVRGFMQLVKRAKITDKKDIVTYCLKELEDIGYCKNLKILTKKMVAIIYKYIDPPALNDENREYLIKNRFFSEEELFVYC